jgi:hypothetical protein
MDHVMMLINHIALRENPLKVCMVFTNQVLQVNGLTRGDAGSIYGIHTLKKEKQ